MKRYFRMVHFVPDPISGARFPMGALVRDGKAWRTVLAKRLPGPESLGGVKTARLLNLLLDDLEKLRTADEIYQRLGPQVLVEERTLIPDEVKDPFVWVQRFALPRKVEVPTSAPKQVRGPTRSTEGKRFLKTHGVGKFVRPRFEPSRFIDSADQRIQHLRPISQWVLGREKLLLMEPMVPRRPQWEEDLTEINTQCSAYGFHLQEGLNGHQGELIVYVLPGGEREERDMIRETLEPVSTVIDGADDTALQGFIDQVRAVGRTQLELGRE